MNSNLARCDLQHRAAQKIKEHLIQEYPNEGCGILVGLINHSGTAAVTRAVGSRNVEVIRKKDRFIIDPRDMLAIEKELAEKKTGERVIGFFHSHPDSAPVPSTTDLQMALGVYDVARETYLYLIAEATRDEIAEIKCWRLNDDLNAFVEVPISSC